MYEFFKSPDNETLHMLCVLYRISFATRNRWTMKQKSAQWPQDLVPRWKTMPPEAQIKSPYIHTMHKFRMLTPFCARRNFCLMGLHPILLDVSIWRWAWWCRMQCARWAMLRETNFNGPLLIHIDNGMLYILPGKFFVCEIIKARSTIKCISISTLIQWYYNHRTQTFGTVFRRNDNKMSHPYFHTSELSVNLTDPWDWRIDWCQDYPSWSAFTILYVNFGHFILP